MVRLRRGGSGARFLVTILLFAAFIYVGSRVGEVYWRYYEFKNVMTQQARFASHFTDDQIRQRVVQSADSLGLPPEAADVTINRTSNHISIGADYVETVEFPMYVRRIAFSPRAEQDY